MSPLGEPLGESRVAVYVPGTANVDKKLGKRTREVCERATLTFLSDLFGGATAQTAKGAWVSKEKGLVVEPVTICFSYCTPSDEQEREVFKLALALKRALGQEAVSVESKGKFYLV